MVITPLNVLQFVAAWNEWAVIALIGSAASLIVSLAILTPALAATVRRLHDTDHSGRWLVAFFVPIANLVVLVFTLLPGMQRRNRFGDPFPHP